MDQHLCSHHTYPQSPLFLLLHHRHRFRHHKSSKRRKQMKSLREHSISSPSHPSTHTIYPFIHPYHHGSWSHEVAGQHSWAPSLCLKTTSNGHGWVTQKGGSWLPRMLTQSSHPILGFCVAPDKGTALSISVPLSGLYISNTRIFSYDPIINLPFIILLLPPPSYTPEDRPRQVHTLVFQTTDPEDSHLLKILIFNLQGGPKGNRHIHTNPCEFGSEHLWDSSKLPTNTDSPSLEHIQK